MALGMAIGKRTRKMQVAELLINGHSSGKVRLRPSKEYRSVGPNADRILLIVTKRDQVKRAILPNRKKRWSDRYSGFNNAGIISGFPWKTMEVGGFEKVIDVDLCRGLVQSYQSIRKKK